MRIAYFIAVITTIFLGLASRKFSHFLPSFIVQNAGDMIWAMMVYLGFRFLFIRKSIIIAIFLSLFFSSAIEFSQLYQGNWVKEIRGNWLGALILGKGFLMVDLIRYVIGIMLATFLDKVSLRFIQHTHFKNQSNENETRSKFR
ncbi:DUF2809 domain-containing protein [Psychrobacillus soli]|uniref:DUF2809 domain-containing protein n=2 Tax=Psychrobacillus soli TaxID=1543965 RepID=A0A544TKM0_9BACI|nr:DUF2809 domain-containing protein [Psychrobacillus soli]